MPTEPTRPHDETTADLVPPNGAHESRPARREAEGRQRRANVPPVRPLPSNPPKTRGSGIKPRKKLSAVVALGFAMTLLATYALPAYALAPAADTTQSRAASADPQKFVVSDVESADVARDAYSVIAPPKPPKISDFAMTAGTFVNNSRSPIQWPFPTSVPITDWFGYRNAPCGACSSEHEGIDFSPGYGTPIGAIAGGVVSEVGGPSGSYGIYVVIDHRIDGQLVSSLYAHMSSEALTVGETVKVGQLVGRVGNTGISTGAHLHLEIHVEGTPVDPFAWLTQRVK